MNPPPDLNLPDLNLPDLSTINGIDATLALVAVALVVLWLYDRDRWRGKVRAVQEQADRWAARTVEVQGEVERLRASVTAEVEALAEAVRHRLELEGQVRWWDLHSPIASVPAVADAVTLPSVEALDVGLRVAEEEA